MPFPPGPDTAMAISVNKNVKRSAGLMCGD
jgi:hypothetical protein